MTRVLSALRPQLLDPNPVKAEDLQRESLERLRRLTWRTSKRSTEDDEADAVARLKQVTEVRAQ